MAFARPGVYLTETLTAPVPLNEVDATAAGCFVGALRHGPTTPQFCGSWSDYQRLYGGFDGDNPVPFAIYSAFQNGCRGAYVVRVASSSAAAATRVINDAATTPDAAVTISAANPGVWGNDINFDVLAAGVNRFVLVVRYHDTVEQFGDLSSDPADPRYFVHVINGQSNLITVVDSGAPTDTSPPAPQTAVSLAGGADGAAPAASDWQAVQPLLDQIDRPLVLNLPGQTDNGILASFVGWGEARGDVFTIVDPALGLTASQALTAAAALPSSTYAATYWPNIVVADPSSRLPGAVRVIPPGGAMLGQYQATDALTGVFKAPAGLQNALAGVVAVESRPTNADLDLMNTSTTPVNAIRQFPGTGVVPYGTRTMRTGTAAKYIPVRRTLIYVRDALIQATRFAVFEPNDPALWAQVTNACNQILQPLYQAGGLRGATPAQAYFVRCDASTNGPAQIQNGEVRLQAGLAVQYPAEFIIITLGQFEGGSTATVSA